MALGLGLGLSARGQGGKLVSEQLGPELAPAFNSGSWAVISGTGATVDASGIHFVNASNIATIGYESAPIEDSVTYKIVYTIANVGTPNSAAATAQTLLYAATTNHLAQTPNRTPIGVGGTYTEYVSTVNAGTATTTAIRVRCNGTSGNNNFDVTYLSVRKVL